mgnify:CR=1 FL=1
MVSGSEGEDELAQKMAGGCWAGLAGAGGVTLLLLCSGVLRRRRRGGGQDGGWGMRWHIRCEVGAGLCWQDGGGAVVAAAVAAAAVAVVVWCSVLLLEPGGRDVRGVGKEAGARVCSSRTKCRLLTPARLPPVCLPLTAQPLHPSSLLAAAAQRSASLSPQKQGAGEGADGADTAPSAQPKRASRWMQEAEEEAAKEAAREAAARGGGPAADAESERSDEEGRGGGEVGAVLRGGHMAGTPKQTGPAPRPASAAAAACEDWAGSRRAHRLCL